MELVEILEKYIGEIKPLDEHGIIGILVASLFGGWESWRRWWFNWPGFMGRCIRES